MLKLKAYNFILPQSHLMRSLGVTVILSEFLEEPCRAVD